MEQAIQEYVEIVDGLWRQAFLAVNQGRELSPLQQVVYAVESLMREANSGISFEQYFRWADVDQIAAICQRLKDVGLDDVAELTARAIAIAFPEGIPQTWEEKSDLTDWTAAQEEALSTLFDELENCNGRVVNVLGAYVVTRGD